MAEAGMLSRFASSERLASFRDKYRNVMAKAREVSETVTETIEVAGTAFAFSWAEGRYGEDKTTFFADKNADGSMVEGTGVPASLLVGLAAHVVIFAGMDGGYTKHIRNIGDGALAHYAVKAGFKLGQKMANDANAVQGDTYTGPAIPAAQSGCTSDEIAAHKHAMEMVRKAAA